MLRVYASLKARVVSGGFLPGERLDPARLASDLAASTTPVRDALNRLSGERLIDAAQHEGFRQPQISEAAIRDLYEWGLDLMQIVARAGFVHGTRAGAAASINEDYAAAVSDSFLTIARLSPNYEHRWAVASLVDRSTILRAAEQQVLAEAILDVSAINEAVSRAAPVDTRRALEQFHRRRLRTVAAVSRALRADS